MIDLEKIRLAPVVSEPFTFFTSPDVLDQGVLESIREDFPEIAKPGVFPLSSLEFGTAFADLIGEVRSPEFSEAVGDKLGVDLAGLPLMITVRGQAQAKDGRIHTDTEDKIATCLIYLNNRWDESGGRLRLLNSGTDLDDYAAELRPNGGAFAAFRVGKASWHGHKPFVGQRRYVMVNWLRSDAALSRQLGRHKLSAMVKKLIPSFYKGAQS